MESILTEKKTAKTKKQTVKKKQVKKTSKPKATSLKLENEINLLKLTGQVKLLGFQLDTKCLLKKSSIFVLPSISEGHPNTILEAMSLGIPVVASNVGGIPELISHQRNGILFDPKDVDGFVHGILTLLRDENVKTKFMKNSFKAVQNKRNIRQMAQSYHILYNGVII